jgi:hypothetical protein
MNKSFHVFLPAPARASSCLSLWRFSLLCASSILSLACTMREEHCRLRLVAATRLVVPLVEFLDLGVQKQQILV